MKCEFCGKKIDMRKKRADGLPAGVGFELENGRIINLCTDCILAKDYRERIRGLEVTTDD